MPPRIYVPNAWRQWERFTVFGFRIHNKRYSAVQGLVTWLLILVALYLLRIFAKNNDDWDDDWDDDRTAQFWQERHLIFCTSPGRSGSLHLRNVLDVADATTSFHEPEPRLTGQIFRDVFLNGKREETFDARAEAKLAAIRTELEGSAPNVAYAETTHMFVKMFADVILQNLGDMANITIVALHRPLHRIVWSQIRLGWFSPSHSGQNEWYYDISKLHQSERILPLQLNFSSSLDRSIGYNADVLQRGVNLRHEVRKMKLRGRWENVRFVDVNITDLSSATGVTTFLNNLGLRADQRRLQLLTNQDDNQRDIKKDRVQNEITMEAVTQRISKLRDKIEDLAKR